MKYFEINEPYYGLLKAENQDDALVQYNAVIADLEEIDEVIEVQRDYALARYSQATGEDGKLIPLKEILESFNDSDICTLVIDGSLL